MGVTVSTAKLAAAYQANNGQTVYVLFEQTFDKNDYDSLKVAGLLIWGFFFLISGCVLSKGD